MTTKVANAQSREILLAQNFDTESALTLRHLASQYKKERVAIADAAAEAAKLGLSAPKARAAAAAWALGRSDEAAALAAKDGSSAICVLLCGIIAEESGNLEEALKHYRKAAELAPSSPPCVLRQLSALRRLGQADEALKLIGKLRREFSDKADLAYHEGRCLEDLGQQQEALDCYEKALAVNPSHAESLYHAARLCDLRGLDRQAVDYLRKIAGGTGGNYVNACLSLALLHDDNGEQDKAIALYKKVLKVDPNNPRAKLFLSDCEAAQDMYYSPEETKQSEQLEAVLRVPVSDFELSVRSRNCLANMNINNLGDLVKKTESEMLAYKNFGETSLREIKEMLSSRGLRLGMLREDAATRAAMDRARRNSNEQLLNKSISELELGVRSRKCMDSLGVATIGDLATKSEADLAKAKNFGRVSLNEIKKRLSEMGLSLRDPRG